MTARDELMRPASLSGERASPTGVGSDSTAAMLCGSADDILGLMLNAVNINLMALLSTLLEGQLIRGGSGGFAIFVDHRGRRAEGGCGLGDPALSLYRNRENVDMERFNLAALVNLLNLFMQLERVC